MGFGEPRPLDSYRLAMAAVLLTAIAVVGALVFAVVWEWCAIRRTLAAHRRRGPESFWHDNAAVTVPERRP
jgi:hypothetical protein